MSSILDKTNTQIDWYEEICQQLDSLRVEAHDFADEEDIIPPDSAFEAAKEVFRKLRELASFPRMPKAHVWLGPEGQIGLTWKTPTICLEIIQGEAVTARVYSQESQRPVQLNDVPLEMAKLAA